MPPGLRKCWEKGEAFQNTGKGDLSAIRRRGDTDHLERRGFRFPVREGEGRGGALKSEKRYEHVFLEGAIKKKWARYHSAQQKKKEGKKSGSGLGEGGRRVGHFYGEKRRSSLAFPTRSRGGRRLILSREKKSRRKILCYQNSQGSLLTCISRLSILATG